MPPTHSPLSASQWPEIAARRAAANARTRPRDPTRLGVSELGQHARTMRWVVTGGSGFVGVALAEHLLRTPDAYVVLTDVRAMPTCCSTWNGERFHFVQADLLNEQALLSAFEGADVVVHAASIVPMGPFPDRELAYRVNVQGTMNVIDASVLSGVTRLIYISTVDVVIPKQLSQAPDAAYTLRHDSPVPHVPDMLYGVYAETKARAEQLVLAASGSNGVTSVSLRPALVYGPRDAHNVPVVASAAASGSLVALLGSAEARMHYVYVGNLVHAIVCAAMAPARHVGGEAFHIVDEPCVNYWEHMRPTLAPTKHPLPTRRLPYRLMLCLAVWTEWLCWLVNLVLRVRLQPTFNCISVRAVCLSQVFADGCAKARQRMGYEPPFSREEAMRATNAYWHDRLL